jgi:hypothetical protein
MMSDRAAATEGPRVSVTGDPRAPADELDEAEQLVRMRPESAGDGAASPTAWQRRAAGVRPLGHLERRRLIAAVAILGVLIVAALVELVWQLQAPRPAPKGLVDPDKGTYTWTYHDLGGHPVVVHAGELGSARFVTQPHGPPRPLNVVAVDHSAAEKDCATLRKDYLSWSTSNAGNATARARQSAYAAYSRDQAKAVGCLWAG